MPNHCFSNATQMPQTRLQTFISAVNPSQRTSKARWTSSVHCSDATTRFSVAFCTTGPLLYSPLTDRLLFSTFTWYTQMSEMTPGFATSTVTPLWCSCSVERTEMRSQNEKKVRTSVQDHQQQSLGSHKSTSTFVPSVCNTRGDQDYVLIAVRVEQSTPTLYWFQEC